MVKLVNQLLSVATTVKRFAIYQANASSTKKSSWKKVVGNVVERKEVPAATDVKKDAIQPSLVLKNLVKLRFVSIVNVATDLCKRFASQALISL